MNINIEIKKRHLVFVLALFLVGGIYATGTHLWSEIDVDDGAIPVAKLNPAGVGDIVRVTNPGGAQISIQEALYEAGGGIGPNAATTLVVGITGPTNTIDKYINCPPGYAAIGMTFSNKRPYQLKCQKIAFNHFNCEQVVAGSNDGPKPAPSADQNWKVDCPNNKVVTSIHCNTYTSNFNAMACAKVTYITCCEASFDVSDSEDDWDDCDSLARTSGWQEKGDEYAITGIYDNDHNFGVVKNVKYCKVPGWSP